MNRRYLPGIIASAFSAALLAMSAATRVGAGRDSRVASDRSS